ncbi:hypothetical protein O181_042679 [Austropuccinia psidii MF-1]|uniref:Secreted protein n=1 Tax=Austropuccinia psidii MF-1 TaxID=1389203 RepID=A0A9Q3DGV8_9BASI|nr:hypothetical protein [Austropuccinia psidii MF-1]
MAGTLQAMPLAMRPLLVVALSGACSTAIQSQTIERGLACEKAPSHQSLGNRPIRNPTCLSSHGNAEVHYQHRVGK